MAQTESEQQKKLLMEGRFLSAEAAREVQKKADADPDDLDSRLQLIAYYHGASFLSADAKQAHEELALWFIENHPEAPIGDDPAAHIDAILSPAAYAKAKALWLKKVEDDGENPTILANAASFFRLHDPSSAEELLLRAQKLDPNNSKWAQELGRLYKLASLRAPGEQRRAIAAKSLEQFERCLDLQRKPEFVNYLLTDLAVVAFEAGADAKAEQFATRLLAASKEGSRTWNSGNAIHHGNLVLGRLALKSGNVDQAKVHLLEAGKTPGSPQLNSFGPNMTLAKELLEKGEKAVVLEYFELCRKFWHEDDTLNEWREAVNDNKIPDFRANLYY